jgi:Icc protein
MLIGQITDIHIGFNPGNPDDPNQRRLEAVLDRLVHGQNRPDLLLVTGDLTEHGDADSYARLARTLAACPFPCWPIPGNHDERERFAAAFPQVRPDDGFCHYAIEATGLRILMLDTFEPGRHGGAFCEARAAWLQAQLAAHPDTPTVIAMHHPPFEAGIPWMDTDPTEPWVTRFTDAVRGHHQVCAILCGHVHRVIVAPWQGIATIVCPSVAPAVALDLNAIDPDRPDNRKLIAEQPPGYALHRWNGRELVCHFDDAADHPVLVRFDERHRQMVAGMLAERP